MNRSYRSLILFFLFIGLIEIKSAISQNTFWEQTNGPYDGNKIFVEVTSLISTDITEIIAATGNNGMFKTTDKGNTWNKISSAVDINEVISLYAHQNKYLFAASLGGGIFRSSDSGNNWTLSSNGLHDFNVLCLTIDQNGNLFAGTMSSLYKSTNLGDSWNEKGFINSEVYALCVNQLGNIFASVKDKIFKSSDTGDHWENVSSSLSGFYCFVLFNDKQDRLFAGSAFGAVNALINSTDEGKNWTSPVLSGSNITNLIEDVSGKLYAATYNNGIFCSTDNGISWIDLNSGLTDYQVNYLSIDSSGFLFAATSSAGVFRSKQSLNDIKQSSSPSYRSYSLDQNYPNPFGAATNSGSSSTSIQFQLQNPTNVTLKIFNALGVEIKTLINNEEYESGTHSIDFDLRTSHLELRTGIYFYQLITPEFTQTKKMVVLRYNNSR